MAAIKTIKRILARFSFREAEIAELELEQECDAYGWLPLTRAHTRGDKIQGVPVTVVEQDVLTDE